MLTSATSVIERRVPINTTHTTHPYEAGWALEAVFFIQAENEHPDLSIQTQISPDGLTWVNRGVPVNLPADETITSLDLYRFGGWLRLRITGASDFRPATLLIHLALKG